jgi:hypothetical protein
LNSDTIIVLSVFKYFFFFIDLLLFQKRAFR